MKCKDVLAIIDDSVQITLYTCIGRIIKTGYKEELTRYENWFVHDIYPNNDTIELMIDAEY